MYLPDKILICVENLRNHVRLYLEVCEKPLSNERLCVVLFRECVCSKQDIANKAGTSIRNRLTSGGVSSTDANQLLVIVSKLLPEQSPQDAAHTHAEGKLL